jgi:hypothetical protein
MKLNVFVLLLRCIQLIHSLFSWAKTCTIPDIAVVDTWWFVT